VSYNQELQAFLDETKGIATDVMMLLGEVKAKRVPVLTAIEAVQTCIDALKKHDSMRTLLTPVIAFCGAAKETLKRELS
jgi:hypothetical protein